MNVAFSQLIIETSSYLRACIEHVFDKGFPVFEGDTVISSCKSHSYDPTLVHLPSSQQLDLARAIIQEPVPGWDQSWVSLLTPSVGRKMYIKGVIHTVKK